MGFGKIISKGGNSGFCQVVDKRIFPGWANSGEISFYELELTDKHFSAKKLMEKYQISKIQGAACHALSFVDV